VSRNSLFSLITFGFLAIFTASCSSNSSTPANSTSPSPATNPATSTAPAAAASPAATFNNPVVASKDEAKEKAEEEAKNPTVKAADGDNISGLLPASESDSIVRSTTKGRSDPFAKVALPIVTTSNNTKVSNTGLQPAKLASNAGTLTIVKTGSNSIATPSSSGSTIIPSSTIATKKIGSGLGAASVAKLASTVNKPSSTLTPGNLAVKPATITPGKKPFRNPFLEPGNTGKPSPDAVRPPEVAVRDIPKPLQPDLAKAIAVTGVAQVNGQTQVILKLPNESFSRYVSVGEKVMDGQVLVKRVQEFSGMTPVVILEELGIEVPRKVGEKVVIAGKEAPAPQR
jgi:hypothetical protein